MQIQILHLCHIVLILHLVIERLGDCHGIGSVGADLQQCLAFLRCEHIGVADKAFFQILALADEEVSAAVCRHFLCDVSDAATQSAGQLIIGRPARFAVDVVAAEDLVGTLAGEHDFQGLGSQIAHEVQGDRCRIRQRFVHVILDHGQLFPVFFRCDDFVIILLADRLGEALCPADLVIAFFCTEADRECLIHIGNGCHIAGIHAAGQERANFYIGDLVSLYAVVERIRNAVHPCVQIRLLVCLEVNVPVPLHGKFAVLIGEIVCRRQLIHPLEKGFVTGRVLERQIVFQCGGVQYLFKMRMAQKALDL